MTGRIYRVAPNGNGGIRGSDNSTYDFTVDACDFIPDIGIHVAFELVDNNRVVNIHQIEPPPADETKPTTTQEETDDMFINPYNFVRTPAPADGERLSDSPDHHIYRADRLTGRLRCRLTTHSPFFIPDTSSRRVTNNHPYYKFFRVNDVPTIPANSLKGMLRSVYEALTNSCYAKIDDENEMINFREPAGQNPRLVSGIILRLPDNDNKGIILECQSTPIEVTYTASHPQNGALVEFTSGDKYSLGTGADKGFLKITGKKNASNKKFERIFYHVFFKTLSPSLSTVELAKCRRELEENYSGDIHYFNSAKKNRFDSIQQTQIKSELARLYEPGNTKFNFEDGTVYYHRGLQVGDLVYFKQRTVCGQRMAEHLSYVSLPKSSFRKNVHKLIKLQSPDLLPCASVERLCPACRLFGAADIDDGHGNNISLAGRLTISQGSYTGNPEAEFLTTTLKILALPHETATNFYLINNDYNNMTTVVKRTGEGYDQHQPSVPIIRGRKFYWHQLDPENEESSLPESFYSTNNKLKFNRTVELLVTTQAEFTFDIHFENLSGAEFAQLLWTVELEDHMYHKLGYGKPLGLGTVKITLDQDDSYLVDCRHYYLAIDSSEARRSFADLNLNWRREEENNQPIIQLQRNDSETVTVPITHAEAFKDLRAILSPHDFPFSLIKYPAVSGSGFQWFMNNPNQCLKTIQEVIAGEKQNGYSE